MSSNLLSENFCPHHNEPQPCKYCEANRNFKPGDAKPAKETTSQGGCKSCRASISPAPHYLQPTRIFSSEEERSLYQAVVLKQETRQTLHRRESDINVKLQFVEHMMREATLLLTDAVSGMETRSRANTLNLIGLLNKRNQQAQEIVTNMRLEKDWIFRELHAPLAYTTEEADYIRSLQARRAAPAVPPSFKDEMDKLL